MVATGTSVRPRKSENTQRDALTVRRELIPLEHGDAQDVLVQVFDEELTAEVPFWVDGVILRPRGVALCSHRQLTVRVTLTIRLAGF